MQKTTAYKPIRTIYGVFIVIFGLLTTSCKSQATPTIEQSSSDLPQKQVTDWPESATKISPGQHLRFETISLEEGLSQSTVFCMLQDSQGFMWFGTEDGLNKYDGYNFTVYKNDPDDSKSLGNNYITALLEDGLGNFWIGTRDGGFDYFDRKQNQFIHYRNDPENPDSLSSDRITALLLDQRGNLWIGTEDKGLDRLILSTSGRNQETSQDDQHFFHYRHDSSNPNSLSSNTVLEIYESLDGALWVGTEGQGLNRLDPQREIWQIFVYDPSDPDSISNNEITAIAEDQSGVLWFGTGGGGLVKYDQDGERFIHYHPNPIEHDGSTNDEITEISPDRDGTLWIATLGGGIKNFDSGKETFSHYQNIPGDPHSLSSGIVYTILQDREGVLWLGVNGVGINKLGLGRWKFAHYKNDPNNPNSLSDNMIWDIYQETEGALWVGTMVGGLNRFDPETQSWNHFHHDPDDPSSISSDWVWTIYKDRSDVLWIGTRNGLDRFDPEISSNSEKGTFTHFQAVPGEASQSNSNKVTIIYEDLAGDFWIGTEDGVYRFDRETTSWSQSSSLGSSLPELLRSAFVTTFFEDQVGKLWIGTLGRGLGVYDPAMETFVQYEYDPDDPNSLASNTVLAFFQDRDGVLWIGTQDGLEVFEPETETFTHYRVQDGLPNDVIYSILEDKQGHFWLSTNKGLSRFDPQQETFKNYDVTDGLQSNEFNGKSSFVNEHGEMYLGGIDGFNVFIPEEIRDNPTIPPVVLTSLRHRDTQENLVPIGEGLQEVTLQWPENAFEFEYAALSYAQPEKNQYAYYLDGFDDTWNNVGTRRYGQYTNLPGGTYTLRVKGSNNDGIWNEDGAAVKITVVPPFWATWWFQVIILLVLVGGIYCGYRLRLRNLENRSRELEIQVEERTAELMQAKEVLMQNEMEKAITAERNRLARDLHDSVTQALYSQTLYAEAAARLLSAGESQTAAEHVDEMRHTAQQALQEMRLLIFELRPSVLAEEGIVSAVQIRLESVEERCGFTTEFKVAGEIELPSNIEEGLYWISQEALNNIVKHAQASKVTVILKQEPHTIILDILDNGVGFDPEKQSNHGGLGLRGIQERVDQLGGQITIESQPGKGTRVHVEVSL